MLLDFEEIRGTILGEVVRVTLDLKGDVDLTELSPLG